MMRCVYLNLYQERFHFQELRTKIILFLSVKVRALLHRYGEKYLEFQQQLENRTAEGPSMRRRRRSSTVTRENSNSTNPITIELEEETETESVPPRKRSALNILSIFGDNELQRETEEVDIDISLTITVEINKYISEPVAAVEGEFNILKWWSVNEFKFPMLAKLSRLIHSIPATSAPSERLFSSAGGTVTEKRSRLNPEILNSLLFLKSNMEMKTST